MMNLDTLTKEDILYKPVPLRDLLGTPCERINRVDSI